MGLWRTGGSWGEGKEGRGGAARPLGLQGQCVCTCVLVYWCLQTNIDRVGKERWNVVTRARPLGEGSDEGSPQTWTAPCHGCMYNQPRGFNGSLITHHGAQRRTVAQIKHRSIRHKILGDLGGVWAWASLQLEVQTTEPTALTQRNCSPAASERRDSDPGFCFTETRRPRGQRDDPVTTTQHSTTRIRNRRRTRTWAVDPQGCRRYVPPHLVSASPHRVVRLAFKLAAQSWLSKGRSVKKKKKKDKKYRYYPQGRL